MEQTTTPPRKRILFVITKSVLGGAQRYVYDLATSLPRDSYEVAVAFGGNGTLGSNPGKLEEMLTIFGIRTILVPELTRDFQYSNDKAAYNALSRLFKEESPDIVHLNSSKVGGLGALAARLNKVPKIIFTAHGWPFWEPRSFPIRIIIFLFSWLTVALSHHTITVSEHDRRALKFMPFVNKKIVTIHNGVRASTPLSREDARAALFSEEVINSHKEDLWVTSVVELTNNKNLFRAIDAVTLINSSSKGQSVFYTIIGDGEQREMIDHYINEHDLSESIHLSGLVPDGKRYLQAFDALLLPSLKEGLPYAIIEAGGASIPVAASNIGGIPEIITDGVSGTLIEDPKDPKEIAKAIQTLTNADVRKKFAEALLLRVEKDFSFERMRAKTISLY